MFELVVNTYNSLKYVHVLSAVVWVGGACTVQAFAIRISATGDGARMATFAKDAEYVGNRDLPAVVDHPARLGDLHHPRVGRGVELRPDVGADRPRA